MSLTERTLNLMSEPALKSSNCALNVVGVTDFDVPELASVTT
jgi:hypothetical protein